MSTSESTITGEIKLSKEQLRLWQFKGSISIHHDRAFDILFKKVDINKASMTDTGERCHPPLITSLICYNDRAFYALMARPDIDITVTDSANGTSAEIPAYLYAVSMGDPKKARMFLDRGVSVDTFSVTSATDRAVCSLVGPNLLRATWPKRKIDATKLKPRPPLVSDADIAAFLQKDFRSQVSDWFHQQGVFKVAKGDDPGIPFPLSEDDQSPIVIDYEGNIELLGLLFSKNASVSTTCPDNVSAYERVMAPGRYSQGKYSNAFFGDFKANPKVESVSADGKVVTFKLDMQNRCGSASIPVLVRYNFTRLQEKFEKYVAAQRQLGGAESVERRVVAKVMELDSKIHVDLKKLGDAQQQGKDAVAGKLEHLSAAQAKQQNDLAEAKANADRALARTDSHALALHKHAKVLDPIADRKERIRKLKGGSLVFFNIVSSCMKDTFLTYRQVSTGLIKRDDMTKSAVAASILGFLASAAPAPFSTAFSIFSTATEKLGYRHETGVYKKIAARIPQFDALPAWAEDITLDLLEHSKGYFDTFFAAERLTDSEMEDVAKLILTVGIYTVYDVDNLKIEHPEKMQGVDLAQLVRQKIVDAVKHSPYIFKGLEEVRAKANKRIQRENAQQKVADDKKAQIDREAEAFIASMVGESAGRGRTSKGVGSDVPPPSAMTHQFRASAGRAQPNGQTAGVASAGAGAGAAVPVAAKAASPLPAPSPAAQRAAAASASPALAPKPAASPAAAASAPAGAASITHLKDARDARDAAARRAAPSAPAVAAAAAPRTSEKKVVVISA